MQQYHPEWKANVIEQKRLYGRQWCLRQPSAETPEEWAARIGPTCSPKAWEVFVQARDKADAHGVQLPSLHALLCWRDHATGLVLG